MLYRLVAVPAAYLDATEVVVVDEMDTFYLFESDPARLTPLSAAETRAVMSFFEPACSSCWQLLGQLGDLGPASGGGAALAP